MNNYPIQIVGRLNEVKRNGEVGPGGAYHSYSVCWENNGYHGSNGITFQCGPRNVSGSENGVLDGDLLEIVRDRLSCFQAGEFACEENAKALQHVEEALMWMAQRAHNRHQRGVLGTYNK